MVVVEAGADVAVVAPPDALAGVVVVADPDAGGSL
jgi:hypothetical protein